MSETDRERIAAIRERLNVGVTSFARGDVEFLLTLVSPSVSGEPREESNPFNCDIGNIAAILTKRFAHGDPGSGLTLNCHEAHMLVGLFARPAVSGEPADPLDQLRQRIQEADKKVHLMREPTAHECRDQLLVDSDIQTQRYQRLHWVGKLAAYREAEELFSAPLAATREQKDSTRGGNQATGSVSSPPQRPSGDLSASVPEEDDDYGDSALNVSEIATAEIIAILAHYGQTTKSEGMIYLHHPAAVMVSVPREYKAVAWLHDVLEDSTFTEGHLLAAGIEHATIDAVKLLTREDKSEPYKDYIERIATSGNRAVITVKIADLRHNLRPSCPESLAARYRPALARLLGVDGGVGDAQNCTTIADKNDDPSKDPRALPAQPESDTDIKLQMICRLVNGYYNDSTSVTAQQTLQAIADVLSKQAVEPSLAAQPEARWQPIAKLITQCEKNAREERMLEILAAEESAKAAHRMVAQAFELVVRQLLKALPLPSSAPDTETENKG